ncbi:tRNA (adenosine(37)-N6)-dimethylallyltransferase MiaA [Parasulfuritortus cantonensis]|uniref:tRNA dimethylallyltransferase n=1 Tax=Parasulfuritortus cantonensis TaxID=2528202 RepID=A0A4R1B6H6_9PROT|nr:tRNA (adenosine(37)-N6)-dimethylallyltransferase MiaA [Parasulfuritortus cantonensis]TCJ11868.1 tRNA (adenosine(37)-N6)-dimethylallyltransferase MiaA [Parasulfuritortus cantonensis]
MTGAAGRPPAVFLMGPTASGKTDLAVALAGRFPFELISVDSALVYRGMDIGTAKPDAATLAACPHHLVDVVDPTERYSAGRFRSDALALMAEIGARGRIPLLVGGTMLYFKALKDGLGAALPEADPDLRAELEARAAVSGWPALHAELAGFDPVAAARIKANDSQRIQRAIEVYRLTGRPLSELLDQPAQALPYRLIELAVQPPERAVLHERINRRFRMMLEAGLVDELRRLRAGYALDPALPAMRSVGYRQAWQFLEGEIDAAGLYETGAAATRQLAKRQITWLRSWQGARHFDSTRPDLVEAVSAWLAERLSE